MNIDWRLWLTPILTRLEPFLDLLDARYLPLLFAGAPQAWTVYAWLLAGGAPKEIATLGGIGFEFVYVGAVAWAERGAGWQAARGPALTALVFSVAVSVAHYGAAQGALAVLHAGFPIVAYFYMLMMHQRRPSAPDSGAPTPEPAPQMVEETIVVARRELSLRQLAKLIDKPETTLRRQLAQLEEA